MEIRSLLSSYFFSSLIKPISLMLIFYVMYSIDQSITEFVSAFLGNATECDCAPSISSKERNCVPKLLAIAIPSTAQYVPGFHRCRGTLLIPIHFTVCQNFHEPFWRANKSPVCVDSVFSLSQVQDFTLVFFSFMSFLPACWAVLSSQHDVVLELAPSFRLRMDSVSVNAGCFWGAPFLRGCPLILQSVGYPLTSIIQTNVHHLLFFP